MDCVNHPGEDAPYQCHRCKAPICVDCETKMGGLSICPACRGQLRQRISSRLEAETRGINYPAAFIAGVFMSGAVACAWSQCAVWTGYRVEVGAALLGALVGYMVMLGAGGKRSHALQQIASVLAIFGVFFAHFLILLRVGSPAQLSARTFGSPLIAAVYAFPAHLASLGPLDWLFLALAALLAYWIPRPRSLPRQVA